MLLLISDGKTADVRCFEKSILVPKGKTRFFGKPQNDGVEGGLGMARRKKAFPLGGRWTRSGRMRGIVWRGTPHQSLRDSFSPRRSRDSSASLRMTGYFVRNDRVGKARFFGKPQNDRILRSE
jgi:hypothetical protein